MHMIILIDFDCLWPIRLYSHNSLFNQRSYTDHCNNHITPKKKKKKTTKITTGKASK